MSIKPTGAEDSQPRALELLNRMLALHEAAIDCGTCGDQLDCLAELVAAGQDPNKVLPAICEHLQCCSDCNEEFQALLAVLNAEHNGKL